ncbi:conserved hypothetical protein [Beggiatoa sp. PS]|nr:conserved hypothetical protein [Beggiatoa sp. PS]
MRKSGIALPINPEQSVIVLSEWLNKEFSQAAEMGWQMLESFGGPVAAFRDSVTIKQAKLINLGTDDPFILVVEIHPPKNEKVKIILRLQTKKEGSYLPENLKLTLLSESGEPLQEIRANHEGIINASQGERFSVQIALREVKVIEHFVV